MAENQGNNNSSSSNTSAEENTNTAPSAPIVWLRGEDAGAHRRTWPELVGVSAEEAEKKVKEDMPRARVQVVPPDCFVTMDYRLDRVRLFLDSTGKVARPPTLG